MIFVAVILKCFNFSRASRVLPVEPSKAGVWNGTIVGLPLSPTSLPCHLFPCSARVATGSRQLSDSLLGEGCRCGCNVSSVDIKWNCMWVREAGCGFEEAGGGAVVDRVKRNSGGISDLSYQLMFRSV
jgi:hypothetical protein